MNNKKEDSRIIKTRRALVLAFLDLLEEKAYEDISINELCTKANVRRATFYKHYKDKTDFLYAVVRILRESFDKKVWVNLGDGFTKEYYLCYAQQLIAFFTERRGIVKNMLSSEARGTLIGVMIHQNVTDTRKRLEESERNGMKLPASPSTLASMLSGSVATTIVRWFMMGEDKPEAELIREISDIIDRML
ncbi:MAG: TetR/AcrR family transcriptional regulator [Clostridia bacterium]|nr:TetR/AcrR family transcriptional regulator [Clostridia bacterium]